MTKKEARPSLAVIGCGVIGLTTGILLARNGHKVTIYASEISPHTTSDAACAILEPEPFAMIDPSIKLKGSSLAQLRNWTITSLKTFEILESSDCGVEKVNFTFASDKKELTPFYKNLVEKFKEGRFEDGPPEFKYYYGMDTYVVEMPKYMPWLLNEFKKLGGKVIRKDVKRADLKRLNSHIIFNCSGLGSRELFNDNTFKPLKGQLLLFKPVTTKLAIGTDWFCIIPRSDGLGVGTLLIEDDESLDEDLAGTKKILEEAKRWAETNMGKRMGLNPNMFNDAIGKKKYRINVGIRPTRKAGPRVEREVIEDLVVYHNYGHGGSGVTFSWGCATEIVQMFEKDLIR